MANRHKASSGWVDKTRDRIPAEKGNSNPFSSAGNKVNTASDFSKPSNALGSIIVNQEAWGAAKASSRYKGNTEHPMGTGPACGSFNYNTAQDPVNYQDNSGGGNGCYHNDVPEGSWLKGGGKGGEGNPNYIPGYRSPGPHVGAPERSVEESGQSGHELRQHSLHRRPTGSNNMGSRGRTPGSDLAGKQDHNATRGRRG